MASNGSFLLNKRISLFETIYNLRRSLKLQAYPFDKWKKNLNEKNSILNKRVGYSWRNQIRYCQT